MTLYKTKPHWRRIQQITPSNTKVCFAAALFLIALLARYLVFVFYFDAKIPFGADSDGYIEFGRSLAVGELSLPDYLAGGGYSATYLYPLFLAVHYGIFGIHQSPVIVTQVILSSCVAVIVFLIAWETIGKRGAYLAGFMAAFYFYEIQWAFYPLTDSLSVFLVSLAFYLFIKFSENRSRLYLIAGFCALIVSLLERLDNAIFIPALLLWLALHSNLPKPLDSPRRVILLWLVVFIIASPYLIKPYAEGPRAILSDYIMWEKWKYRIGGAPGMHDMTWEEIRAFLIHHPGRFVYLAFDKFADSWLLPWRPGYSRAHTVVNAILFPLMLFAVIFTTIVWIKGKTNRKGVLLLGLWLSKTLFIITTHVDWDYRYRLPVDFIALICVAHTLDTALSFTRRRLLPAPTS